MKGIRNSIAKALVIASLSALSASALTVHAASPFPSEAASNDIGMPDNGQSYADLHNAKSERADGSSFPSEAPSNDTGMPDNGQSYADLHNAKSERADGSSFPPETPSNDTGMPDNGQSYADLHRAGNGA